MDQQLEEEDLKFGRYFPNETEMPILINYLQVYFSHPERSIQRSQVVQNVVTMLSPNNKHWNHRTVRLWFNNNKRVFLKPNSQEQQSEHPQYQKPTVKMMIPARSMSVVPFQRVRQEEVLPQKKPLLVARPSTFADVYLNEKNNLIKIVAGKLQAQLKSEEKLSYTIKKNHDQLINKIISKNSTLKTIDSDNCILDGNPPTVTNIEGIIEASTFCNDKPIYASTNFDRLISYGNEASISSGFSYPISSITFDEVEKTVYAHSFDRIKSFHLDFDSSTFIPGREIKANSMQNSILHCHNHSLILATGSKILYWFLDKEHESDTFDLCFTLMVPTISSLITVGENIVVASSEYHSPFIFSKNGANISRPLGHTAGITCLKEFDDENLFLSGSADETSRIWDVRFNSPAFTFIKHKGILTAVEGSEKDFKVFTASTDGIMKCWDLRNVNYNVRKYVIGDPVAQSIKYCQKSKICKVVVSENSYYKYYDLGKYETVLTTKLPLNGIIEFKSH